MIPELGNFALILAAIVALILGTLPLIGAHTNRTAWVAAVSYTHLTLPTSDLV